MAQSRNVVSSFSERDLIAGPLNYRFAGLGSGRTHGSDRALGSRQPTSCTNFCGADSLPRWLSPYCCDIAPQIPVFRGFCIRGFCRAIGNSEAPLVPAKRSTIGNEPAQHQGPLTI
jgi:hypothetical protein